MIISFQMPPDLTWLQMSQFLNWHRFAWSLAGVPLFHRELSSQWWRSLLQTLLVFITRWPSPHSVKPTGFCVPTAMIEWVCRYCHCPVPSSGHYPFTLWLRLHSSSPVSHDIEGLAALKRGIVFLPPASAPFAEAAEPAKWESFAGAPSGRFTICQFLAVLQIATILPFSKTHHYLFFLSQSFVVMRKTSLCF